MRKAPRVVFTQVIARHGDRAPSVALVDKNNDAARWTPRLPDAKTLEALEQTFPAVREEAASTCKELPKDAAANPFGALTAKGGAEMTALGVQLRDWLKKCTGRAVAPHEVYAQSTNYNRTIQSCQFLLRGLLSSTHESDSTVEEENQSTNQIVDSLGLINADGSQVAAIHVPEGNCFNPFESGDNSAELWAHCNRLNQTLPFLEREKEMQLIKALMFRHLPGLNNSSSASSSNSGADDINARIQWIKAMDHFVCAQAHGDVLAHVDLEQNGEVGQAVALHVGWRFHHWYAHPEVLRLMAGPLLRHLAKRLKEAGIADAVRQKGVGSNAAVVEGESGGESEGEVPQQNSRVTTDVLLTHDVTILALHHALSLLGQHHCNSSNSIGSSENSQDFPSSSSSSSQQLPQWWWPPYGSAIVLQLTSTADTVSDDDISFDKKRSVAGEDDDLRGSKEHEDSSSSSNNRRNRNLRLNHHLCDNSDHGWGAGYQLHMYATPWEGLSLPQEGTRSSGDDRDDSKHPLKHLRSSVPARAFEL